MSGWRPTPSTRPSATSSGSGWSSSTSTPRNVIRKHLESHRAHYEALLAVYTRQLRAIHAGTFERLRKRLASSPAETHEVVTQLKVLALQGDAMRARNEIGWADDALLWLDGVTARRDGASGAGAEDTP